MPQIFEILGYPISDNSSKVIESRKKAYCPFMNSTCDGGGNRFMSEISLKDHPELQDYFPNMDRVPSGICSIQLSANTAPWIICPRRLLYIGHKANRRTLLGTTQKQLLERCCFQLGDRVGIWAETKVKYIVDNTTYVDSSFDYTFDYVLCKLGRKSLKEASVLTGMTETELKRKLTTAGHTLALINGELTIEDFPIGKPFIIEVMTSSTSGGNKKMRSCIPQAFEDCILGKSHIAPGINYRQVWARMVSQLIVKSQAAIAWGGSTICVLQDLLADYITSSTALDLNKFIAENLSEVNILAYSYGDKYLYTKDACVVELSDSQLYSGSIRPYANNMKLKPSFQDIVLASVCPPKSVLLSSLCKKPLSNILYL